MVLINHHTAEIVKLQIERTEKQKREEEERKKREAELRLKKEEELLKRREEEERKKMEDQMQGEPSEVGQLDEERREAERNIREQIMEVENESRDETGNHIGMVS